MKIISKYKDYYDYLRGIYGEDERLILDRRKSEHPTYYDNGRMLFTIGNVCVEVLCIDGKFYCGESDMIKLGGEKIIYKDSPHVAYRVEHKQYGYDSKKVASYVKVTPWGLERSTDKYDEYAIYLLTNEYNRKICPYPRLEQYGIQKVLSPHEIWVELSNWLSQQVTKREPVVPVGDDKIRIVSAGFDLKTSFRHRK